MILIIFRLKVIDRENNYAAETVLQSSVTFRRTIIITTHGFIWTVSFFLYLFALFLPAYTSF